MILQSSDHLGSGIGDHARVPTHNGLANNGSLEFKAGDQGIWEFGVTYDSITYTGNVIDSLYNVNGGMATLNNGLAPWGGATATKAGKITSYTDPAIDRDRRHAAVPDRLPAATSSAATLSLSGATGHLPARSAMSTRKARWRSRSTGPMAGPRLPCRSTMIPIVTMYSAAYTTPHLQALVQYTFSHFSDNVSFVNLPYPTSNTAAPFQRSAAYSTPPSNDAHYLTFMAGTDVVPLTHINANARVGLEVQNNQFAPNTADPTPSGAGLNTLNSRARAPRHRRPT